MIVNLSKRMRFFSISCCLLFILLVTSVLLSSQTIDLAYSRENYAQRLENQTNRLKQLIITDNIYASEYSVSSWQKLQNKLTTLLNSPPALTPQQQTLQNSINSQNDSVNRLFVQITKNKLKHANSAIKKHLNERLMTQFEAIRSDSLQLSSIAHNDIHNTIRNAAIFIILVAFISVTVLLISAFTFTRIVRKSLLEVKRAFKKNHSGHFEKIHLSHQSDEFETIVNAFNEMNEKLDERTQVLEELSNTDALTKVGNRRALFERAKLEFSRAKRNNSQLTLLLLDCDLFKGINDEFGHLVGDEFLIRICNVCRQEIRDVDFVARFGGEEFIVVLPHCDITGGLDTASRIQRSLAQHPVNIEGKDIRVTLSIGACTLDKKHENLEQLINDVDKAMYKAKENGRNRIEVLSNQNLH